MVSTCVTVRFTRECKLILHLSAPLEFGVRTSSSDEIFEEISLPGHQRLCTPIISIILADHQYCINRSSVSTGNQTRIIALVQVPKKIRRLCSRALLYWNTNEQPRGVGQFVSILRQAAGTRVCVVVV